MIHLDDMTVTRPQGRDGDVVVLERISLSVAQGEFVAVVGANGSGKTTLLHAMAGVIMPASGSRRVAHGPAPSGFDPDRATSRSSRADTGGRRHDEPVVGLLLQEPDDQFIAGRVDHELLLSVPASYSTASGLARVEEAIDRFGLTPFTGRNPHQLSGGEKQRLAMATVWVADPELLLLDEPTSYLDAEASRRCEGFVAEMHSRGVTVVWTALDERSVPGASRVLRLAGGRVERDGPPRRVSSPGPPASLLADRPRGEGANVLCFERVSFAYPSRDPALPVFSDLSAAIAGGESCGVFGPNGAGKTTVLGLAAGVLAPTTGRVTRAFEGMAKDGRQNVFQLFQSPERLFFADTVAEEVAFGLRALGYDRGTIRRRVDVALEGMELAPDVYRERSPFQMSFGEMRRLAFAIADALEPRLLLLDEPTSCLDEGGWRLLARLIDRRLDAGSAVMVASHDERAVEATTDYRWELGASASRPPRTSA